MIPEFPSQGCIWAARNTSQVGTYPQINISVFTLISPNETVTVNSLVSETLYKVAVCYSQVTSLMTDSSSQCAEPGYKPPPSNPHRDSELPLIGI